MSDNGIEFISWGSGGAAVHSTQRILNWSGDPIQSDDLLVAFYAASVNTTPGSGWTQRSYTNVNGVWIGAYTRRGSWSQFNLGTGSTISTTIVVVQLRGLEATHDEWWEAIELDSTAFTSGTSVDIPHSGSGNFLLGAVIGSNFGSVPGVPTGMNLIRQHSSGTSYRSGTFYADVGDGTYTSTFSSFSGGARAFGLAISAEEADTSTDIEVSVSSTGELTLVGHLPSFMGSPDWTVFPPQSEITFQTYEPTLDIGVKVNVVLPEAQLNLFSHSAGIKSATDFKGLDFGSSTFDLNVYNATSEHEWDVPQSWLGTLTDHTYSTYRAPSIQHPGNGWSGSAPTSATRFFTNDGEPKDDLTSSQQNWKGLVLWQPGTGNQTALRMSRSIPSNDFELRFTLAHWNHENATGIDRRVQLGVPGESASAWRTLFDITDIPQVPGTTKNNIHNGYYNLRIVHWNSMLAVKYWPELDSEPQEWSSITRFNTSSDETVLWITNNINSTVSAPLAISKFSLKAISTDIVGYSTFDLQTYDAEVEAINIYAHDAVVASPSATLAFQPRMPRLFIEAPAIPLLVNSWSGGWLIMYPTIPPDLGPSATYQGPLTPPFLNFNVSNLSGGRRWDVQIAYIQWSGHEDFRFMDYDWVVLHKEQTTWTGGGQDFGFMLVYRIVGHDNHLKPLSVERLGDKTTGGSVQWGHAVWRNLNNAAPILPTPIRRGDWSDRITVGRNENLPSLSMSFSAGRNDFIWPSELVQQFKANGGGSYPRVMISYSDPHTSVVDVPWALRFGSPQEAPWLSYSFLLQSEWPPDAMVGTGGVVVMPQLREWTGEEFYPSPDQADPSWFHLKFNEGTVKRHAEDVYPSMGNVWYNNDVWNYWQANSEEDPSFKSWRADHEVAPNSITNFNTAPDQYEQPAHGITFESSNINYNNPTVQAFNRNNQDYLKAYTSSLQNAGRIRIRLEKASNPAATQSDPVFEIRAQKGDGFSVSADGFLRFRVDGYPAQSHTITSSNPQTFTLTLVDLDPAQEHVWVEFVEVRNLKILWANIANSYTTPGEGVMKFRGIGYSGEPYSDVGSYMIGRYKGPNLRGLNARGGWSVSMWVRPEWDILSFSNYGFNEPVYLFRAGKTRLRIVKGGYIEATWGRKNFPDAIVLFLPQEKDGQPHPGPHNVRLRPGEWNFIQFYIFENTAFLFVNDQYSWASWLGLDDGVAEDPTNNNEPIFVGGRDTFTRLENADGVFGEEGPRQEFSSDSWMTEPTTWRERRPGMSSIIRQQVGPLMPARYPGFKGQIRDVYISRTDRADYSQTGREPIFRYRATTGSALRPSLRMSAKTPEITTQPFVWVLDRFMRPDADKWGHPDFIYGRELQLSPSPGAVFTPQTGGPRRIGPADGWLHRKAQRLMWGVINENTAQVTDVFNTTGRHYNTTVNNNWARNWSRSNIMAPGHDNLDVKFRLYVTPGPFRFIGDPSLIPFILAGQLGTIGGYRWDTPKFHASFRVTGNFGWVAGLPQSAYSIYIGNGRFDGDADANFTMRERLRINLQYRQPGGAVRQDAFFCTNDDTLITPLASWPIDQFIGQYMWVRFRIQGQNLFLKFWPGNGNEPSQWNGAIGNVPGPSYGMGFSFHSKAAFYEGAAVQPDWPDNISGPGLWRLDQFAASDGRTISPLPTIVSPSVTLAPPSTSMTFSGKPAQIGTFTIINSEIEVADTGQITMGSFDPEEITFMTNVKVPRRIMLLTPRTPSVTSISNIEIEPSQSQINIDAHDPSVSVDYEASVDKAQLSFDSHDVEILAPDALVDPDTAEVSFVGLALGATDNIVDPVELTLVTYDAQLETDLNALNEPPTEQIVFDGIGAEVSSVAHAKLQAPTTSFGFLPGTAEVMISRITEANIVSAESSEFTANDAERLTELDFGTLMIGDHRMSAFRVANSSSSDSFIVSATGNNKPLVAGAEFSFDGYTWSKYLHIHLERNAISEVIRMRLKIPENTVPGNGTLLLRVESVEDVA